MTTRGDWCEPYAHGIYVAPADAWIDPSIPSPRALVTHGHADHARGGHGAVWATPETLAIMETRYGPQSGVPVTYGAPLTLGEGAVTVVRSGERRGGKEGVRTWRSGGVR